MCVCYVACAMCPTAYVPEASLMRRICTSDPLVVDMASYCYLQVLRG